MPAPISEEIGRVVREVGLGLSLPEALDHLVNRVHSDDLELIVTAINIQHEVGGNLASILETISQTIRDRVRLHGEIRSLTAQQTLTGYLLSLLPFIVGLILFLLSPKYMMRLLTPGPTLCIPIGAVISIGIGFFVMRKLTAIEA
jgi:tight adherence protein B